MFIRFFIFTYSSCPLSDRQGLNLRPPDPQPGALPTELRSDTRQDRPILSVFFKKNKRGDFKKPLFPGALFVMSTESLTLPVEMAWERSRSQGPFGRLSTGGVKM